MSLILQLYDGVIKAELFHNISLIYFRVSKHNKLELISQTLPIDGSILNETVKAK